MQKPFGYVPNHNRLLSLAKKKGGPKAARSTYRICFELFAVAEEVQQEHEHVHEVQVQAKRIVDG